MFDNSSIIVGLEIGTSKVCAVVGELDEGRDALDALAATRAVRRCRNDLDALERSVWDDLSRQIG